jgi:hypothetical protein
LLINKNIFYNNLLTNASKFFISTIKSSAVNLLKKPRLRPALRMHGPAVSVMSNWTSEGDVAIDTQAARPVALMRRPGTLPLDSATCQQPDVMKILISLPSQMHFPAHLPKYPGSNVHTVS